MASKKQPKWPWKTNEILVRKRTPNEAQKYLQKHIPNEPQKNVKNSIKFRSQKKPFYVREREALMLRVWLSSNVSVERLARTVYGTQKWPSKNGSKTQPIGAHMIPNMETQQLWNWNPKQFGWNQRCPESPNSIKMVGSISSVNFQQIGCSIWAPLWFILAPCGVHAGSIWALRIHWKSNKN